MEERFSGPVSGSGAFELGPKPKVPGALRASFLLWLIAIGAGVFETGLAVIDALSGDSGLGMGVIVGVGVRLIVFGAAVYVASRMRLGKNWARITLAIVLGVLGTLSLVVSPISWLAGGHSIVGFLAGADTMTLLFASSRIVHTAAVLAATAFMFLPSANAYFRYARSATGRRQD